MERLTDDQRAALRAYNLAKRDNIPAFDLLVNVYLLLTTDQEKHYNSLSLELNNGRRTIDLQNTWKNLNL